MAIRPQIHTAFNSAIPVVLDKALHTHEDVHGNSVCKSETYKTTEGDETLGSHHAMEYRCHVVKLYT